MLEINLLPVREERRKAGQRQILVVLGACLIVSLAVVTAHYFKVRGDLKSAQASLAHTQTQIDKLKPELEQVEEYKSVKANIERKLDTIDNLDRSRTGPVKVFDEIATHIPDRLWLTKFQHSSNGVVIEGLSLDNELVALFMTALGDSPYFQSVELEETRAAEVDGFRLNEFRVRAAAVMATPKVTAQNAQ